ncbi:hypothetical protein B9J87_06295 [Vibrio sp. V19_P1S1T109]|uniref:hypothetical protein n=1 Tax=Vibrio sp. V19_P1S1T109 TaxID=1938672 RepID=UPI000B8E9826|nr:hypothetical protein [Vibrio sp. V19_P1S1T109]OXX73290.1 hypothetical protein B9J87_06295 [Vibrio sp. V19_P1S1T109]
MINEEQILERIESLESNVALSYSKAGLIARPELALKQIKTTAELDGLYFCLGKKRPSYACDEHSQARFR